MPWSGCSALHGVNPNLKKGDFNIDLLKYEILDLIILLILLVLNLVSIEIDTHSS